jgi:hypothetical protein
VEEEIIDATTEEGKDRWKQIEEEGKERVKQSEEEAEPKWKDVEKDSLAGKFSDT